MTDLPPHLTTRTCAVFAVLKDSPVAVPAWLPIDPRDVPERQVLELMDALERTAQLLRAQHAIDRMRDTWPAGLQAVAMDIVSVDDGSGSDAWTLTLAGFSAECVYDASQISEVQVEQWLGEVAGPWRLDKPEMRALFSQLFPAVVHGPEALPAAIDSEGPAVVAWLEEQRLNAKVPPAPAPSPVRMRI